MGLLIFFVVIVIVVGGPLFWMAQRFKRRPGQMDVVLIRHSNSEQDKALTVGALNSAGIYSHVITSGAINRWQVGTSGLAGGQWEIWVPARDEERAREVLGI